MRCFVAFSCRKWNCSYNCLGCFSHRRNHTVWITVFMGKIMEHVKLSLCISFWKTRKVRGWLAPWFIWHNLACDMKAASYKTKLRRLKKYAA